MVLIGCRRCASSIRNYDNHQIAKNTMKDLSKKELAIKELIASGATHEKKENSSGETKSGWWMDTVFLAPYGMPELAISILKG
jgi:hypothetical protein